MARTVGIGIQDYAELITNDYFYIDKTPFIKEWWESGDSVTLITRPRRFGKTLNLNMLEYFFSNKHAGRGDLFEGRFIWEDEKYRQLQGTYPVISLSFARIKESTFEATRDKICEVISNSYLEYSYIKNSDAFIDADRIYFDRILSGDMKETEATSAIHKLSNFLYRYYEKKVIILLDEYDTPMQEAYIKGYWDELTVFTRSLFNSTFKTNPYMVRGIMTGITRVSKESIFSDLNNLKVVTTTSNEYATSFGFTEVEVFEALEECGLGDTKEEVKTWYDGFKFGDYRDIYNPWSVLNFLDTGILQAYWANSSSNSLVGKLIKQGSRRVKILFETLLKGESIHCPIDEQIVYNQLDRKENAIWSLLLASGYLKVIRYEKGEEITSGTYAEYELTLTNYEVKRMFLCMVNDWFEETGESYGEFVKAMLAGDKKAMNAYMNRVSVEIFSYFDTGKRASGTEPERFYHGFVLGLVAELYGKYIVTSNRESGFGRYDVMIEPKDKTKDALILEFKVHDPEDETDLQETVAAALQQIEEKQYASVLMKKGFSTEHIRRYGFAFEGKRVLIG